MLEKGFWQIKDLDTGGIYVSKFTYSKDKVQGVDSVRIQQVQGGKIVEVGSSPLFNIVGSQVVRRSQTLRKHNEFTRGGPARGPLAASGDRSGVSGPLSRREQRRLRLLLHHPPSVWQEKPGLFTPCEKAGSG